MLYTVTLVLLIFTTFLMKIDTKIRAIRDPKRSYPISQPGGEYAVPGISCELIKKNGVNNKPKKNSQYKK